VAEVVMGFGLHSHARRSGDMAVMEEVDGNEGTWDGDMAPTKQGGRGWVMCSHWHSWWLSTWWLCSDLRHLARCKRLWVDVGGDSRGTHQGSGAVAVAVMT
jgi:hypothetical protein